VKFIAWLCVILLLWACAPDAADAASFASLTLEWNPNPETDIAGYIVYWGTESGVYPDSVDVGDQTSW
jgi:hypothetical protein